MLRKYCLMLPFLLSLALWLLSLCRAFRGYLLMSMKLLFPIILFPVTRVLSPPYLFLIMVSPLSALVFPWLVGFWILIFQPHGHLFTVTGQLCQLNYSLQVLLMFVNQILPVPHSNWTSQNSNTIPYFETLLLLLARLIKLGTKTTSYYFINTSPFFFSGVAFVVIVVRVTVCLGDFVVFFQQWYF